MQDYQDPHGRRSIENCCDIVSSLYGELQYMQSPSLFGVHPSTIFCYVERQMEHITDKIFGHLDYGCLRNAERVCCTWRKVVLNTQAWKTILYRNASPFLLFFFCRNRVFKPLHRDILRWRTFSSGMICWTILKASVNSRQMRQWVQLLLHSVGKHVVWLQTK